MNKKVHKLFYLNRHLNHHLKKNLKISNLIIIVLTVPLLKKIKISLIKKENFPIKFNLKNKKEIKVMMSSIHIFQNLM